MDQREVAVEFVDIARYVPVADGGRIPPFSTLRTMPPVALTSSLALVNEVENVEYARSLGAQGVRVVPIRRQPPVERFLARRSFPRRVLLEMTSRCNYQCRMCPQLALQRPRMDMPADTYCRVVDELDEQGIEGLWLYHLGESLLHPEFDRILRHVSGKRGLGVLWMSTNGRNFTEDKIRVVLASGLDYVNFSAHAVTAATYETVVPLPRGAFDVAQRNLQTWYRLKGGPLRRPFLHCQMIEQETTRHEVDAFIRAHHELAEIVSVNMLEYANLPNNTFGQEQRGRMPLRSCLRVSRNDCFIFSNGDVTLCDAAYNGEIRLGNINERSLLDIWNGDARMKVLDLNASGRMPEIEFCRRCTDYDI